MMRVRAATLSLSVPEERTVLSQRTSLGPFIFSRTVEECSDELQINLLVSSPKPNFHVHPMDLSKNRITSTTDNVLTASDQNWSQRRPRNEARLSSVLFWSPVSPGAYERRTRGFIAHKLLVSLIPTLACTYTLLYQQLSR